MTRATGSIPRLHVIVNPSTNDDCIALTAEVLDAGARLVQVRVKQVADGRERWRLTDALVSLCGEYDATTVVNDRADVAVATDADGVHGGATDLPYAALRKVVGPDRLVGMTARTVGTAKAHEDAGADYLGVGPVYQTATKSGLPEAMGLGGLEAIADAVSIPVIAIAGVTQERVRDLVNAGAHGVAVVSAICTAPSPAEATRRFITALGAP